MYCQYCGIQIDNGSKFCDHCGRPQSGASANPMGFAAGPAELVPQRKAGLGFGVKIGIAAAVIAVVGIVIALVVVFALPKEDDVADDVATERQESVASRDSADSKEEANETAAQAPTAQKVVALKDADKGDLVAYGKYQQDGGTSEKDIEWVVLKVEDGHALLLSAKALDCRPISSSLSTNYDITWEKSDIRDWLNDSFLDAFTEAEVDGIDTTDVEQSNSSDGKTQDKVFLLNESEFNSYVSGSWAKARATEYAQSQGASTFDDQGTANWWLRDYNPNRQTTIDDNSFLNVFYDGTVNDIGYLATEDDIAIRPAMWVSLDGKGVGATSTQGNDKTSSGQGTQAKHGAAESGVVTLSVEAADGSTLTGSVRRDGNGFVIADSTSREYTIDELRALNLSDAELCIAWNEPFARQGYHFKNPGLLSYFQACDWYVDTGNASNLTGAAAVNNERLRQIAEEDASSKRWESLATS